MSLAAAAVARPSNYLIDLGVNQSMRDSVRRVVADYLMKSAVAASGQCGMGGETQIPTLASCCSHVCACV